MAKALTAGIVLAVLNFYAEVAETQPPPMIAAAPPPPPPPPGRGFQLRCSDAFALADQVDPALLVDFQDNAPPGYQVIAVAPLIHPGKSAHRFLVTYRSQYFRRCEDISRVRLDMTTYKPQNSNVGKISVTCGGYIVEYYQYCGCYRRSFRRRRCSNCLSEVFSHMYPPYVEPDGSVMRCDDRDLTCGSQKL